MPIYIEDYEALVSKRDYEMAARMLLEILHGIDSAYGTFDNVLTTYRVESFAGINPMVHLATRFAAAITTLMADDVFNFSEEGFRQAISYQRWLSAIFAITPFKNGDHILRMMNTNPKSTEAESISLPSQLVWKFALIYFPASLISLDIDLLWEINHEMAASLGVALLSPRFNGEAVAYQKREAMIPWLAEKLPQIDSIMSLPSGVMHDAYMHCSYAAREDRHAVKKGINTLVRKQLVTWGIEPIIKKPHKINHADHSKPMAKPVMLVVLEYFTSGHSIYRTHSRTIEGAKKHFHVIGMGYEGQVDALSKAIFDEFVPISGERLDDHLKSIRQVAVERDIDALYMPSVGMFQLTMYLANIRLAPLQTMALGHPATTGSDEMDFVVVEDDYVGDPACFSEKLLRLPKDGMPYRPSEFANARPLVAPLDLDHSKVHVVVAATPMKLNPAFLEACQLIAKGARSKVHFHFLVGSSRGIIHEQARQWVDSMLGDQVTFYSHQNYHDYLRVIQSCDLFINPFPFGNTNGIVDCVTAGLVGVCKTGREVFEHIDEALFKRMKFPDSLIADSTAAYIHKAIMLIDNQSYRDHLRLDLSGPDAVEILFQGRPNIMGEMLLNELKKTKLRK